MSKDGRGYKIFEIASLAEFREYLTHAVEQVARRLERKISYGFPLMISDFKSIVDSWNKRGSE